MRRFVVGDIHGRAKALKEVLAKAKFDYEKDKLIILGDICDGGYATYECVEELLKIKNRVFILGNHDKWFMNHISSGWAEEIWIQQGGADTLKSYGAEVEEANRISDRSKLKTARLRIPVTHQEFFNDHVLYYVEDNMCFVHGGFNPKKHIGEQSRQILLWDRQLIYWAREGNQIPIYDKIFVGHTTTQVFGLTRPIRFKNLIMMDCGAGIDGKLAMMDIDTEKVYLSKKQKTYYEKRKTVALG